MNDSFDNGSLELEVSDFGPIVEAKIDLRPLTVFIGPSNTGKSYLAILIYALHRFFSNDARYGRRFLFRHSQVFRSTQGRKLSQRAINDVLELAEQLTAERAQSSTERRFVLPDRVTDVICYGFSERGQLLLAEIGRCFGIEVTERLIRKGVGSHARVEFRRFISGNAESIDHSLIVSSSKNQFNTAIPKGARLEVPINNVDRQTDYMYHMASDVISSVGRKKTELPNRYIWELLESLANYVNPQMVGPLCLPAYYLPADRTGVMHAHNVVVSALIESAATAGLRPASRMPMLSGVLADFLEQLIALGRPQYQHLRSRNIPGRQIEDRILRGSVGIDKSEGVNYPHFTYTPADWKDSLSLMNASSMVSELAPLVLYLRYLVRPGNVLIVEEPESHLHPAMQVEFARQLAALVLGGFRVIVTTHSEWLLEELANVVRRSAIPSTERDQLENGRFALDSSQVGAWLFHQKRRPRGSVVKEICLDESGLFPSGFEDVAAELHNDWANLSNRAGGAK